MARPDITIIIPVYNEAICIYSNLAKIRKIIEDYNYELIIAEDGSTDSTIAELKKAAYESNNLIVLSFPERKGKGAALSNAITKAKGKIIIYIDGDLATDISIFPRFVNEIAKCDIVIGSRVVTGAQTKRFLHRKLLSLIYNALVCFLFGSKLSDHQTGFKAFKTNKIKPLLPYIKSTKWFWDTEMLILAQRKGYSISEIPINWKERDNLNVMRCIWEMGIEMVNFYFTGSR